MLKKRITNTVKESTAFMSSWLFGGSPKSIEKQEKIGQDELCNSCQLPTKLMSTEFSITAKEYYDALGINVLRESKGDSLFYDIELPKDWSIQHTDHAMWSNLVDDKQRIRANIFYKAAFYDRQAFISHKAFVNITREFVQDNAPYNLHTDKTCILKVVDANGNILKQSDVLNYTEAAAMFSNYENFVKTYYPAMSTNPTAYWD